LISSTSDTLPVHGFIMAKTRALTVLALALPVLCLALITAAQGNSDAGAADASKKRLSDLIAKAREIKEADFTIESWNAMRFALNDADSAAKSPDAGAEATSAYAKLDKAVGSLQPRKRAVNKNPRLGLSASLLAIHPDGPINNAALMWAAADPVEQFELQRATQQSGQFKTIYSGTGTSFNDYGLADGTYFYRVVASRGGTKATSNVQSVTPRKMPAGLATFSNQRPNEESLYEPLKVGNTYYDFKTERDGTALKHVLMRTSSDGKRWSEGTVVMDRNSHPDLGDFKFEAVNIFYDKVNDQFVWWCHWELAKGYGNGKAFVATAKPGQPFKVHHVYNPLGVQVRDMTVFVDDDNTGYLVAASNLPAQGANATMYIFRLNKTYDDVVEVVAKVLEGGYREAPCVVKDNGFYYLTFSQAAGWYPSRGGYMSAHAMAGPWSEPRPLGNPSTFSSQSGGVIEVGTGEHSPRVMMGNRWIRGDGSSHHSALPIYFAEGFAFDDFAPELRYDAGQSFVVPLQMGTLLSQGKPAEATVPPSPGHDVASAFDGNYETFFQSDKKQWPFALTSDLGQPSQIRNVQISWFMAKGSEAFYTYLIEGSVDGKEWSTLVDRSNPADTMVSKTYGFTSDVLEKAPVARYVRVKVLGARLHNTPNNWYPPTIYEMKVFGDTVAR
jgi:hypothetical protein